MSNAQFVGILLAIAATMVTVLVDILIYNARLTELRRHLDMRFNAMERRLDEMLNRWESTDRLLPFP